jgi:hypothetical protein
MLLSLLALSLLLFFSSTHQSSQRHSPASIFSSFVEKYDGNSMPWRYHMTMGLPHSDCQPMELLTCDDILSAKVAFYLGKGRHKTALRALLHNHTVVIRTTSRPKCLTHFLSLFLSLISHTKIFTSQLFQPHSPLLSILNFNSISLPYFSYSRTSGFPRERLFAEGEDLRIGVEEDVEYLTLLAAASCSLRHMPWRTLHG